MPIPTAEKSEPTTGCVTVTIIALILIMAGIAFSWGYGLGSWLEQRKAIEAKVGRWTCDPESGAREFKYGQ